ncbi:MAG: hypothetical protein EP347_04840 [Alphaproteobacteria bacterium]|nr:MAG: hypothetical protein EP347_04840 [Alphaproteobacteria bacterium]
MNTIKPICRPRKKDPAITSNTRDIIVVDAQGFLTAFGKTYRCALGPGGIVSSEEKREGDGAAPAGLYPLRRLLFRPDKLDAPETGLPTTPLNPSDLWCDAPDHPSYNQPVTAPFNASHEKLWREDELYNLVVVLGINDSPPVAGKGSAIFFHVARPDYSPTEGCVAVAQSDLIEILKQCGPQTLIEFQQA